MIDRNVLAADRIPPSARRFVERARTVLSVHALERREDDHLFDRQARVGVPLDPDVIANPKPAAVLLPVIMRQNGLHLVLTERATHLNTHAGQVAFPGGRIEPGEHPADAALREAEEEIGLHRDLATPLGFLPPYFSGTGFRVQPLVALLPPEVEFRPNPDEVGRVFEVSLDHALDLARYRSSTIFFRGRERHFYILDHPDAYIWGVTAGIMRSFAERY